MGEGTERSEEAVNERAWSRERLEEYCAGHVLTCSCDMCRLLAAHKAVRTTKRLCVTCGDTAHHADSVNGTIRTWCATHTPWSRHYEDCPAPCDELMGRDKGKKVEMVTRVVSKKLVSQEASFLTDAKNTFSVSMESNEAKTVHKLVIDATNSYVLTQEDIADLVSILRPYMPPATRG